MAENILNFTTEYSEIPPGEMVLTEASGREAMSTLYEYELSLEVHRRGGLSMEAIEGLLSKDCRIHQMDKVGSSEVHGVLCELQLLAANEASPLLYRAVLVPRLWRATQSFRSRVYQDVDIQKLVTTVLGFSGLEADWWLSREYPLSEYVVQYEESDFAFIARQLEHWGLFYFFRQEPDGEVLVIADQHRAFESHPDFPCVTFNPRKGRSSVRGSVHDIGAIYRPSRANLTVRDYNYRTPSTELIEARPVDTKTGFGTQTLYGDHFKDEQQGKLIAEIRAEQLLNRRESYEGICSIPGLAPGHKFELLDCPVTELNIVYLVTSIEPTLAVTYDQGDEAYQYNFTAIPLERDAPEPVNYRPQRISVKPKIMGFMHGVIDGEAPGTVAPIDEMGRYKVILPLDDAAIPGGKASRWIRMVQPSAGAYYGVHFPLHIGTEVAIIHLDGDPDRPVILGSIPNAETQSPVVQANATQSRIRTSTGIVFELDDDVQSPG